MPNSPITFSSSKSYEDALTRAADLWGIERDYWDIWGNHHFATPEGIAAVLESLAVPTGSTEELDQAAEQRLWNAWNRLVPATSVLSAATGTICVRVPADRADAKLKLSLTLEGGAIESAEVDLATLAVAGSAELRDQAFIEKCVPLPGSRPFGYHQVEASLDNGDAVKGHLILCPDKAYFPEALAGNGRAGGLAVSLYGLRSRTNWGCGDFTDLQRLTDWVAEDLGASFIGLNPLHAIPNRMPYNTSPYLPACSFYKNFIYLDLVAIPEFSTSKWAKKILATPKMQREIAELRAAEHVEYERVARLKLRFLKLLFRDFLLLWQSGDASTAPFREYLKQQGELLEDWAVYCALDAVIHRSNPDIWLWTDWPKEYHDPRSEATREFARTHWRTVLFYQYIQWQIEQQLAAAQAHCVERKMAIGIYHDLALATDRFGADLWAHGPFYVGGCRVGAPPDDFAPNGQDWSFPPPNSDAHYADGYRLFAESIRKNLRHGGALRIDHVMRFFHLFWIPNSLGDAKRGIYVRDRHEDLIRILALESVRNRVLVVGEDLGTVADEVRSTLHKFGILSYRLFYFEKSSDGRMRLPHDYPKQALVSASTHDLPTLAGFWENRDIDARRRVGMFRNDDDYHRQVDERMTDKQRMLDILFTLGLLPKHLSRSARDYPELTGEIHNAIVGFIATTPSTLMVLNEEDLMKQGDQQNLPGTTAEYPNWRHKTRFTVEELYDSPARDFARMFREWLTVTARLNGPARVDQTARSGV